MINDRTSTAAGGETLAFAHLTDAHLTSPQGAAARDLCNKRLLSYLSWQRHRRHVHDPAVLAELVADLKETGAGHIAITGDLTNLGLPDECRAALEWLRGLNSPSRVSLIPGNHDRLVAAPWAETVGLWEPFMATDDSAASGPEDFPTLRKRGPVAFIGLSSAVPTPPLLATGSLGAGQRERLRMLLHDTGEQGLCRVVLIHHPPVPGAYKRRKRLIDADALATLVGDCGAELVLHGHTHRIVAHRLPGPGGARIPVVGLASASSNEGSAARSSRYSLWTVTRLADGSFRLTHRSRRYTGNSRGFRECSDWDPLAED